MLNSSYPISEVEAAGLRSAERLNNLRKQSQPVSQTAMFPGTPESLWPVLSYTDFLNQAVGMQETNNQYLNRDYGGTWMHAQTSNSGLAVAYEELPYEWSAPDQYHVERIHSKGPLKYLRFGVELTPAGPDQTQVSCTIRFVSILPGPVAKLLINKEVAKFMRLFQSLATALAAGTPALQAFFAPLAGQQAKIQSWSTAWADFIPEPDVRQAMADYIARAPERLAYRLRPFELAEAYQLDPLAVLKACLRLSREGLLHLLWDCRCPGCKGPKESFAHLNQIGSQAYCPTCAVSYGLAFDQNLELTFQPAKSLREASDKYFCAGSPGNTPHITWQQNLAPGESREFTLSLKPSVYALRSLSSANECLIAVSDHLTAPSSDSAPAQPLQTEISLELKDAFSPIDGSIQFLQSGSKLKLHNHNGYEVTVMLEDLNWQPLSVTAARVQAVQAFHDLFPEEVLSPGEVLPLQSQILLQACLLSSHDSQEARELFSWLESRIQLHEGAAVPYNDQALIGIFATPFEAQAAAWDICQELEQVSLLLSEPVSLGLGIARGPCEVSVQNGRLAYRGPACKQSEAAARLSNGQGLVLQAELLTEPGMEIFSQDPIAELSYEQTDAPETGSQTWARFSFSIGLAEFLL